MQKDGEDGRKKINEYTRYLSIVLAIIEGIAMIIGFGNQEYLTEGVTITSVLVATMSLTAGAAFLMWLGERITEKGVGNGISIILLINIVSRIPEEDVYKRQGIGRPGPCTPWGKPALGLKTRKKNKKSNKMIIRRRDGKALAK